MAKNKATGWTYGRMAPVLQEIGMISAEKAAAVLEECADYADEPMTQYEIASALEEFGLAVSVHADDIDSVEDDYASLLEDAAALTGGAVTVTNVRLVEGDDDIESGPRDDVIEFERNGVPVRVNAMHYALDYYDQGAACVAIAELSPAEDWRFREVEFDTEPSRGYDSIMVLATHEHAAALEAHFGLRVDGAQSYTTMARLLRELGLVGEERARSVVSEREGHGDANTELTRHRIAEALVEFGLGVSVPAGEDVDAVAARLALEVGDARRPHKVDYGHPEGGPHDSVLVWATPQEAQALGERLGLSLY
ncbi:hypothetical protein [Yinghuangia seranimata]|uniref:hypothetical protein n=1 Tax=Yinghuangia seranimata TaxID=408067 RepID=UPI00248AD886|nr:hypothetical protein [Yinghuangia seranimata]MDI2129884.1 hypothetical protein [Yinghuangia seranimata]